MSAGMSDEFPTNDPTQRQQPVTPPPVSPDGRFWWDGADWKPMPEGSGAALPAGSQVGDIPVPASAALAPKAKKPWHKTGSMWVALVVLAFTILLTGRLIAMSQETAEREKAASEPFDFFTPDEMDCDYLVHGAIRASKKKIGATVHLLDVRVPKIAADYRQTYLPALGAGESKVLVCTGMGGSTLVTRCR